VRGFWTYHNHTEQVLANAKGKVLAGIELSKAVWSTKDQRYHSKDRLIFRFTDGSGFYIYDEPYGGRYMNCDDDLSAFVGATFLGAEVHNVKCREIPCDYDDIVHEIGFLVVSTSLGEFTVETHNEHNGYYGGFGLVACDQEPLEVRV